MQAQISHLQAMVGSSKDWAIDTETSSVEAHSPDFFVAGIGLANENCAFYIDLLSLPAESKTWLINWLKTVRLTAFNVLFDAAALMQFTGEWLNWVGCSYGLGKALSNESWPGQSWSLETFQLDVLGWPTTNKAALAAALKENGLSKKDMWKLSPEILGSYCASDADAAWQLWGLLSRTIDDRNFRYLKDFHTREFLTECRLLVEQQFRGVNINREKLASYCLDLTSRIQTAMQSFLTHPDVARHIEEYNAAIHARWIAAAPPRFNKSGSESVRYANWLAKESTLEKFNVNSKDQLRWLFYEKLQNKPRLFTESGKPAVSKKILPLLGEPGKILNKYNLLVKELSYVERYLEKSERDGKIHLQFNSFGTVTGRLAGSNGVNMQQVPKVKGVTECFIPEAGHKLIQLDTEALEPTILAEFSQDKTLLSLYGPNAKPNDVYLLVASKIDALGREIRKHYDPENPTPESIAAAKKYCKADRGVAKTVHLAATYLAGPQKIHETLTLAGVEITLREVKAIHKQYWELFGGVKAFQEKLTNIWEGNSGWVPSALGLPICVPAALLKDINNRFCQSSGHQFLQTFIYYVDKLRTDRAVEMYPWIVDLHDETIWSVKEGHEDTAAKIFTDALAEANKELEFGIRIKGEPIICSTLADIKSPD